MYVLLSFCCRCVGIPPVFPDPPVPTHLAPPPSHPPIWPLSPTHLVISVHSHPKYPQPAPQTQPLNPCSASPKTQPLNPCSAGPQNPTSEPLLGRPPKPNL